jgi:hypothetical protein
VSPMERRSSLVETRIYMREAHQNKHVRTLSNDKVANISVEQGPNVVLDRQIK